MRHQISSVGAFFFLSPANIKFETDQTNSQQEEFPHGEHTGTAITHCGCKAHGLHSARWRRSGVGRALCLEFQAPWAPAWHPVLTAVSVWALLGAVGYKPYHKVCFSCSTGLWQEAGWDLSAWTSIQEHCVILLLSICTMSTLCLPIKNMLFKPLLMQHKAAFKIKAITRGAPDKLALILETYFHSRFLFLAQLKREKIKVITDRPPSLSLSANTKLLQL